MRLFFLTATSDRGGAETLLVQLLSRLDPRVFTCRVGSLAGGGWLTDVCARLGLEAFNWGSLGLVGRIRALRGQFRAFRPHLVHMFGLRADILGRPLAKAAGVPIVLSVAHSPDPWRRPAHVCLDRMTARFVDQFVAVGRTVAASRVCRERVPRRRIVILPNGVEPPTEEQLASRGSVRESLRTELGLGPDQGPLLLMVGNLRPMKGHDEALAVLVDLLPHFPGLRLAVVGRDVSHGLYQKKAEALGCAGRVLWLGYREDPAPYYAASDLFLMPSYWEGCPTALLEAMAWRLPIVASRVGGIAEVARHDREALLVPPKNPGALAEATRALLQSPDRATTVAAAARRRILERYTLDRMVAGHVGLYQSLYARTLGTRSK